MALLSIYIGLLWGIPSAQTIGVLGSMGSPGLLWGFVCLGYWAWTRVSVRRPPRRQQPVVITYLIFFALVWLSFAFAQARGLPGDEVSPSTTGLLRTVSWAGVILLANDGLTSRAQLFTLAKRFTLFGGLMALLGLAQFFTGEAIIDRVHLPGFTVNPDLLGVMGRSGFVRANATATHPLEFAVVLSGTLPLAIGLATAGIRRGPFAWVIPAGVGLACLLSSSRSAIIGFSVGMVGILPALPRKGRLALGSSIAVGLAIVYVAVPGMLSSLVGLFAGADASTTSRTNGLGITAQVAENHPILGRGFGTFLPKYYILDNQVALLLIEVGLLGVAAFLAVGGAALVQARKARKLAGADGQLAVVAQSLVASTAAALILFAFFDAFSFWMAAGTWAFLVGLSGAINNIARGQVSPQAEATKPDRRLAGNTVRVSLVAAAAAIGSLATVAAWLYILRTPPVYWTKAEVVLVGSDITAEKALVVQPDEDLVPLAVAVERIVNDGHPVTRLNSSEATLFGMGARTGSDAYVLNAGGQWVPQFPKPVIVIETVGASPAEALAANHQAQTEVQAALDRLQNGLEVPREDRAHTVAVLSDPTVAEITASKKSLMMALVASSVVGGLLGVATLDFLLRRRNSGLRHSPATTHPGAINEPES